MWLPRRGGFEDVIGDSDEPACNSDDDDFVGFATLFEAFGHWLQHRVVTRPGTAHDAALVVLQRLFSCHALTHSRPTSSSANPGQKSPSASLQTRTIKLRDQTVFGRQRTNAIMRNWSATAIPRRANRCQAMHGMANSPERESGFHDIVVALTGRRHFRARVAGIADGARRSRGRGSDRRTPPCIGRPDNSPIAPS